MNKLTLSIIISFLLILVMANNIPHGAELYAQISDRSNATIEPIYQGYFVMILFDVGVLVMLFCDDMAISIIIAFFLFIVNILFWNVPWEIRYWHLISFQAKVLCVWKGILSGMFSFLLHRLSDTLRKFIRSILVAKRMKARSISLRAKAISLQPTIVIHPTEMNDYKCEKCERSFAHKNGLNAHKCKQDAAKL